MSQKKVQIVALSNGLLRRTSGFLGIVRFPGGSRWGRNCNSNKKVLNDFNALRVSDSFDLKDI